MSDFIEKTVRWISSAKEVVEQNLEVRSQASSRRTRASHRIVYTCHRDPQSLRAERKKRQKRPNYIYGKGGYVGTKTRAEKRTRGYV